jgi:hypothetical protein
VLDRFHAELPDDVHIIPGEPARNAHEFFTADEFERLFELGREVYPPHPDGYGGTALMIAYHFRCPNNSLPLIWADGRNNAAEGGALPRSPLFPYRPKRRPDTAGGVTVDYSAVSAAGNTTLSVSSTGPTGRLHLPRPEKGVRHEAQGGGSSRVRHSRPARAFDHAGRHAREFRHARLREGSPAEAQGRRAPTNHSKKDPSGKLH